MRYDIYAEFLDQEKLDEIFKKWIEVKWIEIKKNNRINWNRKPREFRRYLERDIEFFHSIVNSFLYGNDNLCPALYSKLQKLLEYYVQINKENLINFAHSILSRDINRYRKNRSPINGLNLEELPKEAYKKFIKDLEYNEIYELFQNIGNTRVSNTVNKHIIFLEIRFKLRKPYLSRDDEDFYIIDNPVVKDKVFKIPIIRSTTWKGSLRHASYMLFIEKLKNNTIGNWKYERSKLVRLFGNEKDNLYNYTNLILAKKLNTEKDEIEKEFSTFLKNNYKMDKARAGRLIFFTTFLNRIDLDVITPLDRERRAPSRGPIILEIVPEEYPKEDVIGKFKLLYIPFDIINDENRLRKEIIEDLEILKEAIPRMMLEYGFSAKKTSGYGVVEDEIEFWINDKHGRGSFEDFKREMNVIIHSFGGNNG